VGRRVPPRRRLRQLPRRGTGRLTGVRPGVASGADQGLEGGTTGQQGGADQVGKAGSSAAGGDRRCHDRLQPWAGGVGREAFGPDQEAVQVREVAGAETDFVARNDDFVAFARDVALHVAAANPLFVTEEKVDPGARDREAKLFEEQAADKPESIRPKIVEGQIRKWLSEVVLLNQEHVNGDKYEGKTIKQLQDEVAAKTGENVRIRRFARFAVGQ